MSTKYIEEVPYIGDFDVVFMPKDSDRKLVRSFDSPYQARQFINKLRRSKRCILVSYPNVGF